MFVRVPGKNKTEVLLNTDQIWKLEVRHFAGFDERIDPLQVKGNPDAKRIYRVFIGTDVLTVDMPEGELGKELDRIYETAK